MFFLKKRRAYIVIKKRGQKGDEKISNRGQKGDEKNGKGDKKYILSYNKEIGIR